MSSSNQHCVRSIIVVTLGIEQVYKAILGLELENQLYATSMGFLIRDDLHGAYDRYEWSWYCKVRARNANDPGQELTQ